MSEPRCTHCGASITESYDIDFTWMVVCQSCQAPHFLWVDDRTYRKIPKTRFSLTRRFNIAQKPDGVSIRYRNLTSVALFILSGFWLTLLLITFSNETQWTVFGVNVASNLIVVWAIRLFFIAVVVVSGYVLVEEIVNRKTVLLRAKSIEISEGPLPSIREIIKRSPLANRVRRIVPQFVESDLSRRQMIETSDIKKVNCTEHISKTEDGDVTTFGVELEIRSGIDILLIKALGTEEEALFIKRGIEQLYHIYHIADKAAKPNRDLGTFKFSD